MKLADFLKLTGISGFLLLVLGVGGLIAYDIWQDRRYRVILTDSTPLFDEPRFDCGFLYAEPIGFALPGEEFQVLRIRYGKLCKTVKISDGRGMQGWILVDESVDLKTP